MAGPRKFKARHGRSGRIGFSEFKQRVTDGERFDVEASRLDRLDLEATVNEVVEKVDALRADVVVVVAYAHVRLDSGDVDTVSSSGIRVTGLTGTTIDFEFNDEQSGYTAAVTNQLDGSTNLFFTQAKDSGGLSVRPVSIAGGGLDPTVGTHDFELVVRRVA